MTLDSPDVTLVEPYFIGTPVLCKTGKAAVQEVQKLYQQNSSAVLQNFTNKVKTSSAQKSKIPGTYPYLAIHVPKSHLNTDERTAYGAVLEPGTYGTTLTSPDIFERYYTEQIDLLIEHHKCPVWVGNSKWAIPLPFINEASTLVLRPADLFDPTMEVTLPDLMKVDDNIANGTHVPHQDAKPLALFTAERADYSLQRLHHYCGTAPEHFQNFVLLTNYQRYVEHFIAYSMDTIKKDTNYTELVEPGDIIHNRETILSGQNTEDRPQHLPQMPAYHLKRKDGNGITFINIGVGPTNAKTITDHLSVTRPHCWLMLGHCAGFRRSQQLGDYVLAHGYVRDDHVLDQDVPPWVPIPPIAEVQMALQEAVVDVTGLSGMDLKTRMRTGTVVSSDNRNWELCSSELFQRYNQTRAIALDLESATVATNGFRFRVPYGTLLCVSDKPLHGELKLRGMATKFYRERVRQHMEIGLRAVQILRERGPQLLHSRKLRGFDEPPFR